MSKEPIQKYLIIVQAVAFGIVLSLGIVSLYKIGHDSTDEALGADLRVFTVRQGGTGTSTTPSDGQVLTGQADGTYAPENFTAPGDGVSNWLYNGSRLTPSTTVGIGVFGSSTIGGGTTNTGLTVLGGATTTALTVGPAAPRVTASTLVQYNDTDGSNSDWAFNVAGGGYPSINLQSTGGTLSSPTQSASAISEIASYAYNSTPAQIKSTSILSTQVIGTASSEQSKIDFKTLNAGNLTTGLTVSGIGYTATYGTTTNATSTSLAVTTKFTLISDVITNVATWFDTKIEALTNVVLQGVWDFGSVTSLEIPNATDPTVDATGEIAVNTTAASSSLRYYDGTAERQLKPEWSWGATFASSSLAYDGAFGQTGTTTVKRSGFKYGVTHSEYYCRTNSGNVTIVVGDGSASSSPIRCSSTGTTDSTASNGAFTPREMILIAVGSANGTTTSDIYFDATARWTTD